MSGNSMTLAPLYDLYSAAPYLTGERRSLPPGKMSIHTAGLAMSVGGERIFSRITGKEWRQLAVRLTVLVSDLILDLVRQIPNAVEVIAARELTGSERAFIEVYVKAVSRQVRRSLVALAGRGAPSRRRRDSD